jgi:hypothetical protein
MSSIKPPGAAPRRRSGSSMRGKHAGETHRAVEAERRFQQ